MVARLDRRVAFSVSINDRELYLSIGADTLTGRIERDSPSAGAGEKFPQRRHEFRAPHHTLRAAVLRARHDQGLDLRVRLVQLGHPAALVSSLPVISIDGTRSAASCRSSTLSVA